MIPYEKLTSTHLRATLVIAVVSLLWSLGPLLIKSIEWPGAAIVGWRAVLVAFIFPLLGYKPKFKFSPALLIGSICYAGACATFVIANKLTFAANIAVLQFTAPIYVALLSGLLLKEQVGRRVWFVVAIVFVGIVMFFLDDLGAGTFLGNCIYPMRSGLSSTRVRWRQSRAKLLVARIAKR